MNAAVDSSFDRHTMQKESGTMKHHGVKGVFFLIVLAQAVFLFLCPGVHARGGWAVIVGIDHYARDEINPLGGAENDARSLARLLPDSMKIPPDHIFLYASGAGKERKPTIGNILSSLRYVSKHCKKDETFVFAFSGHGVSVDKGQFLLTYNTDLRAIPNTALKVDDLRAMIQAIPAARKLVIIDACRNDPVSGRGDTPNLLSEDFARGISVVPKGGALSAGDVASAVIFSCGVGQRAFEWPEKKRGFFSYFLEKGISGYAADDSGKVTLGRLVDYIQKKVPEAVERILGVERKQKPYVLMEGNNPGSWVLASLSPQELAELRKKIKEAGNGGPSLRPDSAFDSEIAKQSSEIDSLDSKIREMKTRMSQGAFKPGDSIEKLFALADRKKKLVAEQKRLLQKKYLELSAALEKYLNKYQEIASDPATKDMAPALWAAMKKSFPEFLENVSQGDIRAARIAISKKVGTWTDPVTGMEFIWVPGGCFMMGQTLQEREWLIKRFGQEDYDKYMNDERPCHEVCVDGFWLGKYEVTREQFARFVAAISYKTDAEKKGTAWIYTEGFFVWKWKQLSGYNWRKTGYPQRDDHPVVCVSWNDANAFADWLSKETGRKFRLPTEAEWEYAARAGSDGIFFWGNDESMACVYANVADKGHDWKFYFPCDDGFKFTAPVGSYKPNAFGLYDMLGNVWEWCADIYASDAYSKHARDNPIYEGGGSCRVGRGGSWDDYARNCRCALRYCDSPGNRNVNLGFRLARTP